MDGERLRESQSKHDELFRELNYLNIRVGLQDRHPGPVCKTSIPGSNPGGASNSKFLIVQHLEI